MNQPKASNPGIDPTYWEYIRLDQLLQLQGGVDGEADVGSVEEMQFIVIHQAIELVFKLVLRELRAAREALSQPRLSESAVPAVAQHLSRVNEGLGIATAHFAFMETLGTQGFLSFRQKLGSSSGAQSHQLRELEELLGLPRSERERVLARLRAELPDPEVARGFEGFILEPLTTIVRRIDNQIEKKAALGLDDRPDVFVKERVEAALEDVKSRGTLRSNLARWLFRTPICGSVPPRDPGDPGEQDKAAVRHFVTDYVARGEGAGWTKAQAEGARTFLFGPGLDWPEERVRAALLFIEVYLDLPLLAWPRLVLDRLVELEARLVGFRNSHARLVERVIGDRPGTGGSAGIRYLDLTRDARIFPELVQVRGLMIPRLHRAIFPGMEGYDFEASLGPDEPST